MSQELKTFTKGAGEDITKNFSSSEFDCHCKLPACRETVIDITHVHRLQDFRDFLWDQLKKKHGDKLGRIQVVVTSGYRCSKWNRLQGGAKHSRHKVSDASDVKVFLLLTTGKRKRVQLGASMVHKLALEFGFDGIGKYNTFTHLDSRGTPARWDKTKES